MKKSFLALFLVLVMCFSLTITAFAWESVTVNIGQTQLSQKGLLVNDSTMVPLRAIAESLKAVVTWDESTQQITLSKLMYRVSSTTDEESIEERRIVLWIGQTRATVNGYESDLPVAPQLINDMTVVPVRAISEWFEASVSWDDESKTVKIVKGPNESFSEARFAKLMRKQSEGESLNKLLDSLGPVTESEVKWISEIGLSRYNIIFEDGTIGYSTKIKAGFYRSGITSKLLYGTPSFKKSLFKDNSPIEVDLITMKLENDELYFYTADLEALNILGDGNSASDFLNKENVELKKFLAEWVSAYVLENKYYLKASWIGNYILISEGDTKYRIEGAPSTKFEPNEIYSGTYNGKTIRFQYIESITLGGDTEQINCICYNYYDLVSAGIISE